MGRVGDKTRLAVAALKCHRADRAVSCRVVLCRVIWLSQLSAAICALAAFNFNARHSVRGRQGGLIEMSAPSNVIKPLIKLINFP